MTLAEPTSTVRKVPEWIGATPDTPIPQRVKLRVWERAGGICEISGIKIRPGDKWQIDHRIALINGGENRENNLRLVLDGPHRTKTDADLKTKSKIARVRAKHLGAWPKSKRPLKSRGFAPSRGRP